MTPIAEFRIVRTDIICFGTRPNMERLTKDDLEFYMHLRYISRQTNREIQQLREGNYPVDAEKLALQTAEYRAMLTRLEESISEPRYTPTAKGIEAAK